MFSCAWCLALSSIVSALTFAESSCDCTSISVTSARRLAFASSTALSVWASTSRTSFVRRAFVVTCSSSVAIFMLSHSSLSCCMDSAFSICWSPEVCRASISIVLDSYSVVCSKLTIMLSGIDTCLMVKVRTHTPYSSSFSFILSTHLWVELSPKRSKMFSTSMSPTMFLMTSSWDARRRESRLAGPRWYEKFRASVMSKVTSRSTETETWSLVLQSLTGASKIMSCRATSRLTLFHGARQCKPGDQVLSLSSSPSTSWPKRVTIALKPEGMETQQQGTLRILVLELSGMSETG
mmetsp:Transcript_19841/g.59477  ORF Transcript_19841/g.59477 Transcript_19841/m.59477 type:complete len:294 (-) Transcript_19841:238-1119(-)